MTTSRFCTNILIPLQEIGLGKTGTAAATATGIAGSKAGQPAGAAGSGNVVLYGDSEVGYIICIASVGVQILYSNSRNPN